MKNIKSDIDVNLESMTNRKHQKAFGIILVIIAVAITATLPADAMIWNYGEFLRSMGDMALPIKILKFIFHAAKSTLALLGSGLLLLEGLLLLK